MADRFVNLGSTPSTLRPQEHPEETPSSSSSPPSSRRAATAEDISRLSGAEQPPHLQKISDIDENNPPTNIDDYLSHRETDTTGHAKMVATSFLAAAAVGAAIGSVVPGIGTLIGGIIGGIYGGLATTAIRGGLKERSDRNEHFEKSIDHEKLNNTLTWIVAHREHANVTTKKKISTLVIKYRATSDVATKIQLLKDIQEKSGYLVDFMKLRPGHADIDVRGHLVNKDPSRLPKPAPNTQQRKELEQKTAVDTTPTNFAAVEQDNHPALGRSGPDFNTINRLSQKNNSEFTFLTSSSSPNLTSLNQLQDSLISEQHHIGRFLQFSADRTSGQTEGLQARQKNLNDQLATVARIIQSEKINPSSIASSSSKANQLATDTLIDLATKANRAMNPLAINITKNEVASLIARPENEIPDVIKNATSGPIAEFYVALLDARIEVGTSTQDSLPMAVRTMRAQQKEALDSVHRLSGIRQNFEIATPKNTTSLLEALKNEQKALESAKQLGLSVDGQLAAAKRKIAALESQQASSSSRTGSPIRGHPQDRVRLTPDIFSKHT